MRTLAAITCVCVLGAFVTPSSATPILVHEWAFNGDLTDSSGSNNTGTLSYGTASYVAGKFGHQAINLADGQTVANAAASNLPTAAAASWRMNIWVQPTTLNSLSYLAGWGGSNGAAGASRAFIDFHTSETAGLYFWGNARDGQPSSAQTYGTDTFHMLTATYQEVNSLPQITLYYDGVQKYQGNWSGTRSDYWDSPLADASQKVQVNSKATPWAASVAGAYQEFTIWSGVLTQTNVTNLFTSNTIVPEPGTLALLATGLLGLLAYAWRKRR
jgi:hypothetical protein